MASSLSSGPHDDYSSCGIYEMDGCMIVPVPGFIHRSLVDELKARVLSGIDKQPVRGIIMDMSAVPVLEGLLFSLFYEMVKMIELMGVRTVFVGFQPGVAVTLVDLDVDIHDIVTAFDLKDGMSLLDDLSAEIFHE